MSLGIWERLQIKFRNDFILPSLTPQTAILGLYKEGYANDNYDILSHNLLIFKYYIYISREKCILNVVILVGNLMKSNEKEE